MASFEVRGNTVRAIVSLGNKQKLTQTFDTDRQARAWAKDMERRKALGQLSVASGLTVKDVFTVYEPIAANTDSGPKDLLRLAKFCETQLAKIALDQVTPHDVQVYVQERLKSIKASSVNRELNLMSAAFTYAVKNKRWISENPCHSVRRPADGPPRQRPLLTDAELEAISISGDYSANCAPITKVQRVVACFFLSMETGLRSGEILRLRPRDIEWEEATLYVHALEKGGRKGARSGQIKADRRVPLTQKALNILLQLVDAMPTEQEPKAGFSMPPYIVGMTDAQRDAHWRKVRDRAGVTDLRFHDMKHEAATRLCKHMDVIALSHAIGTKDIRLLRDTYYLNDAANIARQLPSSLSTFRQTHDRTAIGTAAHPPKPEPASLRN